MHHLFTLALCLFSFIQISAKEQPSKSFLSKLWGLPPDPVVYLGMWTYHFKEGDDNWNNHAYGLEYNGFYACTMINTYYQQCYTMGVSRHWYQKRLSKNTGLSFGYRLGGIYGYDSKLKSIADIAERYKVLPFGQIYTHLIYRRCRLEVSYINQLISFHFAVLLKSY